MNKGQFIDIDYYYDSIIKIPVNNILSGTKTSSSNDIITEYIDKTETDTLICYITTNSNIPSGKLKQLRLCKQLNSDLYKIVFAKEITKTALSSNEYFDLDINIAGMSGIVINLDGDSTLNGTKISTNTLYSITSNNININNNTYTINLSNVKLTGVINSVTLKESSNIIDTIIPIEHLGKICLYSEYRGIYFEPKKE